MCKKSTTEPRRRHELPEKVHIRCLRIGIFRVGGQLGFDTRTVVRFSEVISGRRWRRCAGADLERVVADLGQLAIRVQGRNDEAKTAVTQDEHTGPGRRFG
jgi:hypothetical protein